jgi:hypothetical protein
MNIAWSPPNLVLAHDVFFCTVKMRDAAAPEKP